jgi:hypothetical protein
VDIRIYLKKRSICTAGVACITSVLSYSHFKIFMLWQVNKVTEGLQDAAENVKDGVKGAADKVADAAKKVTGQK